MHIRIVHCIPNFKGETASVPRRKEFQFIRMPKYTYSIWMLYIQVCTYLYGTRVFSALYITAAPSAREIRASVQWLAEFCFFFFCFYRFARQFSRYERVQCCDALNAFGFIVLVAWWGHPATV